jgi:hypothetical protein
MHKQMSGSRANLYPLTISLTAAGSAHGSAHVICRIYL